MKKGVLQKDAGLTTAKPFLKWVGGKGRLIPELSKYYPESFDTFLEPFVGGGAMFFSLNPTKGHINDMNKVLTSAYIHIRDNLDAILEELKVLQDFYWSLPDLEAKKEFYLEKRALFNDLSHDELEKSVLLIFLNKTCFNGMYRENSKGGFNVPFGKHDRPTIADTKNLKLVSEALKDTRVSTGSYKSAVTDAAKGDFIYFDPPYHPLNVTSSFTSYQAGGFTAEDQEELRNTFKMLADRGCYVMLSNSDAPLIRELYKDFNIHEIMAARSINSVGTGRGKIKELLITSY